MAPMHHARNDDPVYVAENFLECFAFVGSAIRQLCTDRSGLSVRCHTQPFDVFAEICSPVR